MIKKIITLFLVISIVGCSTTTPNTVPVAQVGDESKSCDAIANEMQLMVTTKTTAEADQNKQVASNVALGVLGAFLIVPWFFMDLGGAHTAEQKAAQARYERLQQMQIDKKCSKSPVISADNSSPTQTNVPSNAVTSNSLSPSQKLEELNVMYTKGLISKSDFDLKKAEILKGM
jgi:hypothetical protein